MITGDLSDFPNDLATRIKTAPKAIEYALSSEAVLDGMVADVRGLFAKKAVLDVFALNRWETAAIVGAELLAREDKSVRAVPGNLQSRFEAASVQAFDHLRTVLKDGYRDAAVSCRGDAGLLNTLNLIRERYDPAALEKSGKVYAGVNAAYEP